MTTIPDTTTDGQLVLNQSVELPDILDILIVGGGPGGTAAAFRARELGLNALVIDFDDLMKRIRDYAKDKLILPDFGGGDKMTFPQGDGLISLLHFSAIDKDDMCALWKRYYVENNIPAHIGVELLGIERMKSGIWKAKAWNHNIKEEGHYFARHIILTVGKGVPRRLDIPGNTEGIVNRLTDAERYAGEAACVIGGGTSAAEAVIAISNAKADAVDETPVFWSYRGEKMPKVSKALAEVFFDAYLGHGNIRYYPNSDPIAVVTDSDKKEYLVIRTEQKSRGPKPFEHSHLEFPKEHCIACIGEDIPEMLLSKMGIFMTDQGPTNKKRMLVTPILETEQPNVYLSGDILSPTYLETDDFGNPEIFREIKHRGNIKAAMCDSVFIVNTIKQKLEGKPASGRLSYNKDAVFVKKSSRPATRSDGPATVAHGHNGHAGNSVWLTHLVNENGDNTQYQINTDGVTTIGRTECDINITEDMYLSDLHASILCDDSRYYLKDESSSTGVYLKLAPGHHQNLDSSRIVRIGKQFIRFQNSGDKFFAIHFEQTGRELDRTILSDKFTVFGREGEVMPDPNDLSLSRRHLAACVKDGEIVLKDLGSANGSFLRVSDRTELHPGDQFRVGQQLFMLFSGEHKAKITDEPKPEQAPEKAQDPVEANKVRKPVTESVTTFEAENDCSIKIINSGKTLKYEPGQTLAEIAEEHGLELRCECHTGICGSDPIRIVSGLSDPEEADDQEVETIEEICEKDPRKVRLACMVTPKGYMEIELV